MSNFEPQSGIRYSEASLRARAELSGIKRRFSSHALPNGGFFVRSARGVPGISPAGVSDDEMFWMVVRTWENSTISGEISVPSLETSNLYIGRRMTILEDAVLDWKIVGPNGVEGDFVNNMTPPQLREPGEDEGERGTPDYTYVPYEEDEEEYDDSAVLNPGATEQEIDELVGALPVSLPTAWLNVLRVANGFEISRRANFWTMSTEMLVSRVTNPEQWTKSFRSDLDNSFPIAIPTDGGFFALDINTVTDEGDCMVVRMTPGTIAHEESRIDSISVWLADSLNEDDWNKFRGVLPPLPAQSLDYDLLDAARRGHANEVRRLIAAGASVNASDRFGSVLEQARQHGYAEIEKLLRDNGTLD